MRVLVAVALLLIVGTFGGCATTSPPTSPIATSTAGTSIAPGGDVPSPSGVKPGGAPATGAVPSAVARPDHRVIAGPDVVGTFDAATDGDRIAWSSGAIDADAPELWTFDPASGRTALVYRSPVDGAILANLAVRSGTFAFAEVTPGADGSSTWRLVLLDGGGSLHVLDANDAPPASTGILPMAAISDHGILWAVNHDGGAAGLRCELRYASLDDLEPRTVATEPCGGIEFWYPRSDGGSYVFGTVEYGSAGTADDRHVYLVADADLAHPRRLDHDGEASLPDILGDTVVWKTASRRFNMFGSGQLAEATVAGGDAHVVPFAPGGNDRLTMPTLGSGYIAAEGEDSAVVAVWDRATGRTTEIDRLAMTDPGFLSGVRLSGDLLIWFYTSSAQGGGDREIRWLELRPR